MHNFFVGLAIFFFAHTFSLFRSRRRAIINEVGLRIYIIVFSLISIIGLAIMIFGYGELRANVSFNKVFWVSPIWMKHVVFVLMIPAFVFLSAAYIPSRISHIFPHPMLAAVKIWATLHLCVNGDLVSIILFCSFLFFAVAVRLSLKKRLISEQHVATSGSLQISGLGSDLTVVVTGLVAYAFVIFYGHVWVVGVPLVGS